MEHTGTTPAVALHAPDLAQVVTAEGPFLTLYLATEAAVENAAQRSELRWRQVRDELAAAGADEAVLAEVDGLVPDAHHEGQTLAVLARGDGVVHVAHFPEPPKRDLARWGDVPSVGPLLEWRQMSPPHVVVLADRQGADLFGIRWSGPDVQEEAGGGDDPVRKVQAGGWSQRRFQQRAENVWEQNAADVAAEVVRLVRRIDARLVVVAGDVRAVSLLRDELPREIAELVSVIDGGRSVDGSIDSVAEDVVRAAATVVARDTVALLQKFREEAGQGDRAADGAARTVEALRQAQAEVVLVHDDPDDERTAYFGREPTMIGLNPDEVRALGADRVHEGRLVDVVLRAALGTGAGVRIVPSAGGPKDGVGAVLRWT